MKTACRIIVGLVLFAVWVSADTTETRYFGASLSPANESPPVVGVTASGQATILLHIRRNDSGSIISGTAYFDVDYNFAQAATATGLHIHAGAAGVNGPIVIGTDLSSSNSVAVQGAGNIFRSVEVTSGTALTALSGILDNPANYYVNLHTSANPGGLMRGQLQTTTPVSTSGLYYFPHLALGEGWQTTMTYVNYSPQAVTCKTEFFEDSGAPLAVPFGTTAATSRDDALGPGVTIDRESTVDLNAPVVGAWARTQCSGPIKASMLFRFYQGGKAAGEAAVSAVTTPATKFVTFADEITGVAYANPSTEPALISFNAINAAGVKVASATRPLLAGGHGAANLGGELGLFPGLSSFTGSIQVISTVPIVSLSIKAKAFPVISSLPPGDLDGSTALATGSSSSDGPVEPPPYNYDY